MGRSQKHRLVRFFDSWRYYSPPPVTGQPARHAAMHSNPLGPGACLSRRERERGFWSVIALVEKPVTSDKSVDGDAADAALAAAGDTAAFERLYRRHAG